MSDHSSLKRKLKTLRSKTPLLRSKALPPESTSLAAAYDAEEIYYDVDQRFSQGSTSTPSPLYKPSENSQGARPYTTTSGPARSQTISPPVQPASPSFYDSTSSDIMNRSSILSHPSGLFNLPYYCMESSKYIGGHWIERGALNLTEKCQACNQLLFPRTNTGLASLALRQMKELDAKERMKMEERGSYEDAERKDIVETWNDRRATANGGRIEAGPADMSDEMYASPRREM
jgi:hypothetical protein